MRFILLILFVMLVSVSNAQNCSQIRRVCRLASDNELFWNTPSSAPCGTFKEYRIFARDKNTDPFTPLFSIANINTLNLVHANANVPTNKNWEYFIQIVNDCGGIENYCYTDTQNISVFKLPKSVIAYVSVDTTNNLPYIHWEKNTHPSFSYIDVFRIISTDTLIKPFVRDTFVIDNVSRGNPKLGSLKYVIAAVDSCFNRWSYEPIDFHSTIHLIGSIDTCKNKASISWTPYVGWGNNIKIYYIFRKDGAGYFQLIDSVASSVNSYTDSKIVLNQTYNYLVIAQNSINASYRSNSNAIEFKSGLRSTFTQLEIDLVSLEGNALEITLSRNTDADADSLLLLKSTDNITFTPIKTFDFAQNSITIIDITETGNRQVFYKAAIKGVCGNIYDTSKTSTNIKLSIEQIASKNKLVWNKYFTWNSGVKDYTLFRESKVNNNIINPFVNITTVTDSIYDDELGSIFVPGNTYCYQVLGEEKNTGLKSKSNVVCVFGGLIVYFPNGVIGNGVNKTFKPVGVFIDFTKSYLLIYNRWGQLIKTVTDLNIGWDLTDENNNFVGIDTYVYEAHITGEDGKELIKSGHITVIQ
jgi:gliding motility-associated-like protein